jgi:hypothetical protein
VRVAAGTPEADHGAAQALDFRHFGLTATQVTGLILLDLAINLVSGVINEYHRAA